MTHLTKEIYISYNIGNISVYDLYLKQILAEKNTKF
jgi:hypothetical protein